MDYVYIQGIAAVFAEILFCVLHAFLNDMQIPANDVSVYRWTSHTSRALQSKENARAQQKAAEIWL